MVVPKNLDVLFWKILLKKYQPSIFYHGNSHDIGFFHIFPTENLPDPPSAGLLRGRARELLRRDGAERLRAAEALLAAGGRRLRHGPTGWQRGWQRSWMMSGRLENWILEK